MNIAQLKVALEELGVREGAVRIFPPALVEGALCLMRTDEGKWSVLLNERGEYLTDEIFESERDACRYLLRKVLLDPTYRKDFASSDLSSHKDRLPGLLKRFGFD